ncbi:MAG: hypothetical protein JXA52_06910 [Planctomycetes bacterium]|nr:hypothetical protein [Planctomycetota bacterium]
MRIKSAGRLITFFTIGAYLIAVGIPLGPLICNCPIAVAAEAALETAPLMQDKPAPALTEADIIYLKGLLEARSQSQNLASDEKRIIATAKKHLEGTKQTPIKKANQEELEERLKQLLRNEVASSPKARQPRMNLALFYLYSNQPEKAIKHLETAGAGSEDDVFWPLLGAYTYLRLGDHKAAAIFLDRARQAASTLMPLQIQRALFCSEFRTLGQYTPRPSEIFKPGESTDIYVNIIGSRFKQLGENKYLVDLSFDIEIRDELQQVVWRQDNYGGFSCEYQHPVHDGFCDIVFIMPETLAPGNYVLMLTCLDRLSERSDSADLSFTIAGKQARLDDWE